MALICVLIAGSSFINACIFAPCSANPFGAVQRLTQNAVLPVSGLANAIIRLPPPIPPTLSRSTGILNFHLVVTSNKSNTSLTLLVTAGVFSSSILFLCLSIILTISLKLASLPLNISVDSTAILCAKSLSESIRIISFAISLLGSCTSFISSTNSLNFSFAARVNAGLNIAVCNEYNSSTLISSEYFACAFCIVSNKELISPENIVGDIEPLYFV